MKKLTILTAIFATLILTSCTKFYLEKQPIIYEVSGYGAYIDIYSNTQRHSIRTNIDENNFFYTENVERNDSVGVFMMSPYNGQKSKLTIRLGSQILFQESPDSLGYLFISTKLGDNDFRLKKVKR